MGSEVPSNVARAVAERLAGSLVAQGARAVALVGSHAKGTAGPSSDLDLAVIGDGPHYRLEAHESLLVSLGWASPEEQRRRLYDPSYLGSHVPGWRSAVLLHDPEGVAAEIRREALGWVWDQVAAECDTWVAEAFTGYAEEVHKLVSSLQAGNATVAAVQRSVLGLRLPGLLALRRRILFESENRLWELVAEELGPAWRAEHEAALGLHGQSLAATCLAALRLFELAADELRPLLDARQIGVVQSALREAGTMPG